MERQKLCYTIEMQGTTINMNFNGAIDEWCQADLGRIQIIPCKVCRVDMSGVTFVNSTGMSHWIRFINYLKEQAVEVQYVNCSPIFVDHLKLVSILCQGVRVVSVYNRKICSHCGESSIELIYLEDVIGKGSGNGYDSLCKSCYHNTLNRTLVAEDYEFIGSHMKADEWTKVS